MVKARVVHSVDGTVTSPVTIANSQIADAPVGVAFVNGTYMVMWNRTTSVDIANPFIRRVTPVGALDGDAIQVDTRPYWVIGSSILPVGTGFQVMYQKLSSAGSTAWGKPVGVNGTLGDEHTYAKRNQTTNQVPIVFGASVGAKVFVVILRGVPGDNFRSLDQMTQLDVFASVYIP